MTSCAVVLPADENRMSANTLRIDNTEQDHPFYLPSFVQVIAVMFFWDTVYILALLDVFVDQGWSDITSTDGWLR